MFLVDLRSKKITGKEAEVALGRAQTTINKNAIPHDPEKPTVTFGLRVGAAAMTTRDFGEPRRFLPGGGAPLGFTLAHGRHRFQSALIYGGCRAPQTTKLSRSIKNSKQNGKLWTTGRSAST